MWRAERTEQLHRHLMQITEDRSGALEPRGDLVDPASGIVGQGRARRLRVNNDRVLSEVGQRPQGAPTISTLFEPVCRVARHAKTACRVFAAKGAFLAFDDVELGKNAVAPGVQWVVAQDVRLAGPVLQRGTVVPAAPREGHRGNPVLCRKVGEAPRMEHPGSLGEGGVKGG